MKHLGDITQINGSMVEPVNVIIGGSPCQDLSVAGRRAGLAGERSGLFMEQIRIIKEMRCADAARGRTGTDIRPRWMVWEMSPELSAPTKERTLGQSSKKQSKSQSRKSPLFLSLRTDGQQPDASPMWEENGALLGAFSMLSFGECPSVENASHLSQILEASPHPKYSLSAKACLGIVRRAERRGKELPPLLKTALLNQAGLHSASKETASTEPTPQDATAKDGQRA